MILKAKKKSIEIEAMLYNGDMKNRQELNKWCRYDCSITVEGNLGIYNILEKQWINCPIGHYIIKGIKGEFYPCDPDVFKETYDIIDPDCNLGK